MTRRPLIRYRCDRCGALYFFDARDGGYHKCDDPEFVKPEFEAFDLRPIPIPTKAPEWNRECRFPWGTP